MIILLALFSQTVPYGYPHFDIVQSEIEFIPKPHWADTSYRRQLHLEYVMQADDLDSASFRIEGVLVESWLSDNNPSDIQGILHCDSVRFNADTISAYSQVRFGFDRGDRSIRTVHVPAAERYSSVVDTCSIDECLERIGYGREPYLLYPIRENLGIVWFSQVNGGGLCNLGTGAWIVFGIFP